jgi:hypothetical protein
MNASSPVSLAVVEPSRLRWRLPALALCLSVALHTLILGVLDGPETDRPKEMTVELRLEAMPRSVTPNPDPTSPQAPPEPTPAAPTPVAQPAPEPSADSAMRQDQALKGTSDEADLPDLSADRNRPEPAASDPAESAETIPPMSDPDLVTRLLAAPLERDPPPGPFDRAETPEPDFVEFRFPERESMISMLTPALPDLPFADPELDVFMYSPGWQGDLHRGFDKITPEFGYTTNTGFMVRCRWLLIFAGCGWGRSRYSPGMDTARQAREQERRAREEAREARDAEREATPLIFPFNAPDDRPAALPADPPPSVGQ